ncbi:MAG: preprotein translocase subunit SecG [bacterium]
MSLKLIQTLQIIVSVLLMLSILFQSRGTGLGGVFGGTGGVYRTKRGAEKILFAATIIFVIMFIGLGILGLFIY